MLFSVLIPVYNTAKYLDECIQSVLSQTEKDYEIVLLDDGSTDNSGEICDDYSEKNTFIRVIHKQNEGLLMTRRRGFQEAKGDYYICLDSDDYLCDNDAFVKIKRLITEKKCDLVLFNYFMQKETRDKDQRITLFDKPDGYIFEGEKKKELYEKLFAGRDLSALVIKSPKSSIVDRDVDYSKWKDSLYKGQGEDLFQSMPILSNALRIGYIKDILYFYRWNGGSISRNYEPKFYYSYKTIYQREDKYLEYWNISTNIREKNIAHRIETVTGIITSCYHNTNRKEWNDFINDLAEDDFFVNLYRVKNIKSVLLYYRLVGYLVRHRKKLLLQLSIVSVDFVSKGKKKLRSRKEV